MGHRVELPRVDAAGHQVVARPFGCRLGEHGLLDLEEARFTYKAFGLHADVRRAHAARTRFPSDTSVIVAAFVLVAVFAPVIAPYEPATSEWIGEITPSDVPGRSPEHPLGLDSFGSDLLTQLAVSAQGYLALDLVRSTTSRKRSVSPGAANAPSTWVAWTTDSTR